MNSFRAKVTRVAEFEPRPQYNYEPQPEDGPIITMQEFLGHLVEIMEFLQYEIFEPRLAHLVNEAIERFFQQVAVARRKIQIFDDVYLTGVTMKYEFDKFERGVMVRAAGIVVDKIKTESPIKHNRPGGESAYMGRIKGVDVYIGYQGSMHPTIVFSGIGMHFTTFNPMLNTMPQPTHPDYELYSHAKGRYDVATKFYAARMPLRESSGGHY